MPNYQRDNEEKLFVFILWFCFIFQEMLLGKLHIILSFFFCATKQLPIHDTETSY